MFFLIYKNENSFVQPLKIKINFNVEKKHKYYWQVFNGFYTIIPKSQLL